MKTILLWDPRFPDRTPSRLTLDDTVASAAVRAGVAAPANPADAATLLTGGPLDGSSLIEVVLQHGVNGDRLARVFVPTSVHQVALVTGKSAPTGRTAQPATGTPAPSPTVTLVAPTTATVAANAAPGTLLFYVGGVPTGVTPAVSPNDGRFAIAGDAANGWKVVVGLSALSVGTVNVSIIAAGATSATVALTIAAAQTGLTLDYFGATVASAPWYGGATGSNAEYDTVNRVTVIGFEALDPVTMTRIESCHVFDHVKRAAGQDPWSGPFPMFPSTLVDDDHGEPTIAKAYFNGRWYAAGGTHGGAMQLAMSDPNDPSKWTVLPALAPPDDATHGYSYPHLMPVGSKLYLTMRKHRSDISKMPQVMYVADLQADGTPLWGAEKVILDWGNNTRVYLDTPITTAVSGNDAVIRMSGTLADFGDSYRQDVFAFDYVTATGTIRSVDGVFSSAVLPLDLSTCRANLRAVVQTDGSLYTGIPSHCFDSAGVYHVAYLESPVANSTANAAMDVKHKSFANGAWSAPAVIGQVQQRYDVYNIDANAAGGLDALFSISDSYAFLRGGDIARATQPAGGAWGAVQTLMMCGPWAPYDRPCFVKNGVPELRAIWGENAIPPDQGNTGGSHNLTVGNLRMFAWGDSGIVPRAWNQNAGTKAFAARAAVAPSLAQTQVYDALLSSLANMGVLANTDAIYPFVAHDGQAGFLNLVQNAYDIPAATGGMTFAPIAGKTARAWKGEIGRAHV